MLRRIETLNAQAMAEAVSKEVNFNSAAEQVAPVETAPAVDGVPVEMAVAAETTSAAAGRNMERNDSNNRWVRYSN